MIGEPSSGQTPAPPGNWNRPLELDPRTWAPRKKRTRHPLVATDKPLTAALARVTELTILCPPSYLSALHMVVGTWEIKYEWVTVSATNT